MVVECALPELGTGDNIKCQIITMDGYAAPPVSTKHHGRLPRERMQAEMFVTNISRITAPNIVKGFVARHVGTRVRFPFHSSQPHWLVFFCVLRLINVHTEKK